MDLEKVDKELYLLKIEKKGTTMTSYLHGLSHIVSSQYVLPQPIKNLSNSIDCIVTEVDYLKDQDLKDYRNSFYNKILEKHNESKYEVLLPYIEEIKKYKEKDKLEFLFHSDPCVNVQYNGQAKYTEEELYLFFHDKEKRGIETTREAFAVAGHKNVNMQQLAEKNAVTEWKKLKNYALNKSKDHETTFSQSNQKESIDFSTQYKIYVRDHKWFPRLENMIKEKRNLFAFGDWHISHLLLLL